MRVPLLPFILATIVLLPAQPVPVHGSALPADSVHVCAIYGYEQWRRDHPRPAAKRLVDLDVGEPRTVRMIYFLPKDRPLRQEVVDSIKVRIRQVQSFFVDQMEAHGHGRRTLRIETDAQGEPLVHRVDGQHPDSHYLDDTHVVYGEIGEIFDLEQSIYLIVVDHSLNGIGIGGGRVAGGTGSGYKKRGSALVPSSVSFNTVAHELGHAFGLSHDFRDDAYIMSYGSRASTLSACHAEFLAVHPYYNQDSSLESDWERRPTAELITSRSYPPGSLNVPVRLEVGDSEGLHQAILFTVTETGSTWGDVAAGGFEVKACRGLAGEAETVVEFQYDGVIPSSPASSLSSPVAHQIHVEVADTDGNVTRTSFMLAELSPYLSAILEERGSVASVAISPDGTTLASALESSAVGLWDLSALEQVATIRENTRHSGPVGSVVFSPDGATLASASVDGRIRLWDPSARREIAALEGHTDWARTVAFSPDGTTLASGSWDGTVRLWSVSTREQVAALEGHAYGVNHGVESVAFSPDGATLASASPWDDLVRLWSVSAREEIATLEQSGVESVVFSPDGTTLASGSWGGRLSLWSVAGREEAANLKGHTSTISSVVFSPDGTTLASGSRDGMVRLWDVRGQEEITAFGNTNSINSLAFSPDGATLAAGSEDAILLWDVSKWTGRPRPFSLEIISGDDQQGRPGSALAHPLIVEVRDQYGDPLPEATVTFTVTAGGGKLRDRSRIEHVTTDAAGRAELILTLGPDAGTNTVEASIGGGEVVTFQAQGVGTTVTATGEGDYRTWHLPDGAMARLGKGALSHGDRGVAFSPDGRCLAVASAIGVWLYEVATARAISLLPTGGAVLSMALSPGGATLAAGLDNGEIELWEVGTGTRIASLEGREGYRGRVTSVVFSPVGDRFGFGSADGTVKLWDVLAREGIATLEGDGNRITSMVFSPDGETLATGASGRSDIRLWDVSSGETATLEGHTGGVESVAFSPDGGTLVSAGYEVSGSRVLEGEYVKLWDVESKTEVATLEGHGSIVYSVVLSPDGATVASNTPAHVAPRHQELAWCRGLR